MGLDNIPRLSDIALMQDRPGVRFGVAGAAFMARFRVMLEPLSLTPSRVMALAYIHEKPGCDQSSLADTMGFNRASAMLLIDKLAGLGYVERRPGSNRRTNAIFLTRQGEIAFAAAQDAEAELRQEVFGWLTPSQQADFFNIIDRVGQLSLAGLSEARAAQARSEKAA
ncbi:MAG TPA: MarR family transcriptional regulator [Allosphingosinicella sp.]|nr:MarR family transcriptional regulator [Allosphingosinicella sp.]